MDQVNVSEAFVKAGDLMAKRLAKEGMVSLTEVPDLYRIQVDDRWAVEVHAHQDEVIDLLPAFVMRVEFNGWPAAVLDVHGGTFAAGTEANEGKFIEAVEAALQKEAADGQQ